MEKILETLKEKTNIHEGNNYIVSNISAETINGDMKGWLCGHFFPRGSAFHRNDIEICYKVLPVEMEEKEHYHLCSFEFLIILSGKVEYNIDGDSHVLTTGMFYMLNPGNTEHIIKVHEETTIMAIRLPSIPRNQIFTDEGNKDDH